MSSVPPHCPRSSRGGSLMTWALSGTARHGCPALHPPMCLSFPAPVLFQPPGLIQNKQALRFPYTNSPGFSVTGAFLPTSLCAVPPLLPLARSCLLPEWEEGSRKCAQSWQAKCFPLGGNTAFFTFNPEKYGSQESLFLALRVPQGRRIESRRGSRPLSEL